MEILITVAAFVVFDLIAMRWGANSIEAPESAEWERRRSWRGFGG